MTDIQFDNRLRQQLPGDPEEGPRRRDVVAAWSSVSPTPVAAPRLLAYSAEMAQQLGLDEAELAGARFAEVFGGNALYPGMQPWAVNYGGHQFGHWAGQLGDGRAISLGEAIGSMVFATNCSSRALARRRIRVVPMGAPCCARRFENSCAAKRCTIWVCRPRAH